MTAPLIPTQFMLPTNGNQPTTYPELLDLLNCSCIAGSLIRPSTPPTATFDLGDIIAGMAQFMSIFTSVYKWVTVILKMIACIIDVLCALPNPFATISAVIRLFTVCFPELLSLFPQFAILLLIICLIKIILSIVEYIITVLLPLVLDIIQNIQDIKEAFSTGNQDAIMAVSFKIVSLFEELRSLLGLLALLNPIFEMIKALLSAGISIPCLGGGGSCDDCDTPEPQCPPVLQQYSIDGTDGCMTVLYGGGGPFDFNLLFYSSDRRRDFTTIRSFFPPGVNYSEVKSEDELAFCLKEGANSYAVKSVDIIGNLYLSLISSEMNPDGYLSSLVNVVGLPIPIINPPFVRFASATGGLEDAYGKYLEISDTREDCSANSGTWIIDEVYDAYNVKLKRSVDVWVEPSSSMNPEPFIYWKFAPVAPEPGCDKHFSVVINHAELMRHNMISVGCHPAVKASKDSLKNRYPEIMAGTDNLGLTAPLPDLAALIDNVNGAVDKVAPKDMDTKYVQDNYGLIEENIGNMAPEIFGYLNQFKNDSLVYLQDVMPKVLDVEKSTLDAQPRIQIVGEPINISVSAYDRSGDKMGKGLPTGTVFVNVFTTEGELSPVTEILDAYGAVTGDFSAVINSQKPIKASLTAKILNKYISDFDGYNLIPRVVEVEFVDSNEMIRRRISGSPEPLGMVKNG
jgi:hypothetical protein